MQRKVFTNNTAPIPKAYRDEVKRIFLEKLAETNRIDVSAKAAGVSRITAWNWRNSGYVTEEELAECRAAYEVLVQNMLWANWFVHHGRVAEYGNDIFDGMSTRRLVAVARSVLPDWGGKQLHIVRYSTVGWTPSEKADIYNRIREIQKKHRT
jgi:hypothetical protein